MTPAKKTFGAFVKEKRLALGLTLRKAAMDFEVSAAYLSRVESDDEKPSGSFLAKMADMYNVAIEELASLAKASEKSSSAAFGQSLRSKPELRALYRLGNQYGTEEIDEMLRKFLREQGMTDEAEIERRILQLKLEFPRIAKGTDDLLAAQAHRRYLNKAAVTKLAYEFLKRHGLDPVSYAPPTEVEMLVEMEPEIDYRVDDLKCNERGEPLVLGLSCWGLDGRRQVVINSVLADGRRATEVHRFNFTLAHELCHALEHLPRAAGTVLNRHSSFLQDVVFVEVLRPRRSAAERAVNAWVQKDSSRHFLTEEDWREWQANTFAAALLMPEWAVKREFEARTGEKHVLVQKELTKQTALQIAGELVFRDAVHEQSMADKFAVSRQAMAIRLLDLALIKGVAGT
jgi:HTH-type transcriptional regulator, competence development regulator